MGLSGRWRESVLTLLYYRAPVMKVYILFSAIAAPIFWLWFPNAEGSIDGLGVRWNND